MIICRRSAKPLAGWIFCQGAVEKLSVGHDRQSIMSGIDREIFLDPRHIPKHLPFFTEAIGDRIRPGGFKVTGFGRDTIRLQLHY